MPENENSSEVINNSSESESLEVTNQESTNDNDESLDFLDERTKKELGIEDEKPKKTGKDKKPSDSVDDLVKEFEKELKGEQPEKDSEEPESEKEDPELELDYNGEKKKLSLKEAKELAQKGYDYTKKTQSLSEERKAFELERDAYKTESEAAYQQLEKLYKDFDKVVKEHAELGNSLKLMELDDPDLFNQFNEFHKRASARTNNPLIDRRLSEQDKVINELRGELRQYKLGTIRQGHDVELGQFKTKIQPMLDKAGLKPDWSRVSAAWAEGAKDLKTAFFAEYGEKLNNLLDSKSKVLASEKGKKVSTIGTIKKSQSVTPSLKGLSTDQITEMAIKKLNRSF